MNAAALLLVLLVQGERRADPGDHLAEANRLRELALFDRAEEILRSFLRTAPADPQTQRRIPDFRAALCEVLLGGRKYDELKNEAQALRLNPRWRVDACALLAAGAWHAGQVEEAQAACDDGDKAAAEAGSAASAEGRRRLRMYRALLGWRRFESETHIVHHPPDSPIAEDPLSFGRRLDLTFGRIRDEVGATIDGKIEAFYFNDQAQADAIVERALAAASPSLRIYYARADGPPGFGMAQVVSFFVANRRERRPPRLPGLREGFASVHADDARWERRRAEIPPRLAKEGKLPELSRLLARPADDSSDFALGGSFVRWLIRTRGRELFRRLWADYNDLAGPEASPDLRKPWVEIYGTPLEELEAGWRSSIK